jgi:hypothetical protein
MERTAKRTAIVLVLFVLGAVTLPGQQTNVGTIMYAPERN